MRKYYCDHCSKEIAEKDIKMKNLTFCLAVLGGGNFELCRECKEEYYKVETSAELRYKKELLAFFNKDLEVEKNDV